MRKVVVSDSGITLGSLKDLLRQLEDDSLNGDQLKDFLSHRNPFPSQESKEGEYYLPLESGDEIHISYSGVRFAWCVTCFRRGESITNFNDWTAGGSFQHIPAKLEDPHGFAFETAVIMARLYNLDLEEITEPSFFGYAFRLKPLLKATA